MLSEPESWLEGESEERDETCDHACTLPTCDLVTLGLHTFCEYTL